MTPEEMLSWRLYYLSLFAFETTPQVDVVDPAGIVESLALQDADRSLRICLNASASERTMASRFLSEYLGAGVQHIAFATDDIFAVAAAMRSAGAQLLAIPDNYYDDLEARLPLDTPLIDRLRENGVLYDEDEGGAYYQLYTAAFADRFFFEIVQRDGYAGFGAANAPIRLAAQTRLARQDGMPRS
jgi:4-hydroxyphenylpyruvate dioxygenase